LRGGVIQSTWRWRGKTRTISWRSCHRGRKRRSRRNHEYVCSLYCGMIFVLLIHTSQPTLRLLALEAAQPLQSEFVATLSAWNLDRKCCHPTSKAVVKRNHPHTLSCIITHFGHHLLHICVIRGSPSLLHDLLECEYAALTAIVLSSRLGASRRCIERLLRHVM
jgi:hypothetical protein